MDPNACLRRWARALLEENAQEARNAHADLTEWMRRGGFEPSWSVGLPSKAQFQAFDYASGRIV